ncbi:hypothetical protein QQF64_000096 [Cirrhinus molitorella]|uniref:AIG1-type G domain-containing protein n=1 Tax=Cirrhinus molitorella TaxID=172907 RepID=A0ABR3NW97_9TELE
MKKQMMKSLYFSHPGPHVFLLVINLETFREEQRNIVEQIQKNFGEDALKFIMVLFVGREKNNEEQHYSNEIYLKKMRKLREEERMKQVEQRLKEEEAIMTQEQVWKRQTEMKKIPEESDTWKQKVGIDQEQEIKMKSKNEGITYDNVNFDIKLVDTAPSGYGASMWEKTKTLNTAASTLLSNVCSLVKQQKRHG